MTSRGSDALTEICGYKMKMESLKEEHLKITTFGGKLYTLYIHYIYIQIYTFGEED